jgi:hypothetical protein
MDLPIACDLGTMTEVQRSRREDLVLGLRASLREVVELVDGFALRMLPSAVVGVADFVSLERLCCPFLRFSTEIEPGEGPLWLRMTGPDGAKGFLRESFRSIVSGQGS